MTAVTTVNNVNMVEGCEGDLVTAGRGLQLGHSEHCEHRAGGLLPHARKWFLKGVVSDGQDNWSVVTELETGDMYRAGSRSLIS